MIIVKNTCGHGARDSLLSPTMNLTGPTHKKRLTADQIISQIAVKGRVEPKRIRYLPS